jgi:hypothetical protein
LSEIVAGAAQESRPYNANVSATWLSEQQRFMAPTRGGTQDAPSCSPGEDTGQSKEANAVKRVAMAWRIKSDKVEEYTELHQNAWPDVKEANQQDGMHSYSIFMFGDLAFAYLELEGDDIEVAME